MSGGVFSRCGGVLSRRGLVHRPPSTPGYRWTRRSSGGLADVRACFPGNSEPRRRRGVPSPDAGEARQLQFLPSRPRTGGTTMIGRCFWLGATTVSLLAMACSSTDTPAAAGEDVSQTESDTEALSTANVGSDGSGNLAVTTTTNSGGLFLPARC